MIGLLVINGTYLSIMFKGIKSNSQKYSYLVRIFLLISIASKAIFM
jgi:hypothetical protein